METRESANSEYVKTLDTAGLRRDFLVSQVFSPDCVKLTYTHFDRMIFGGVMPVSKGIELSGGFQNEVGSDFLLERRELGVLNLAGKGRVVVDGVQYDIDTEDAIYIGSGTRSVWFYSQNSAIPAKFYLFSATAHVRHPVKVVRREEVISVVKQTPRGVGPRRIITYFSPAVFPTCQIVLGITRVENGTVWHTMPPHMHERRAEIFLYCNMGPEDAVIHLLGKPQETRHLIVQNEEAVIVPGWSVRPGVGTGKFDIVWSMAGENQNIADMDFVPIVVCR